MLYRQIADLNKKVNQLIELITSNIYNKKYSQEEASVYETLLTAWVHIDTGAEMIWYITKVKESSILLPDTFDSNLKHLRKFLLKLDFCFQVAPSKYAGDNAKIITAKKLCSDKKVYPW